MKPHNLWWGKNLTEEQFKGKFEELKLKYGERFVDYDIKIDDNSDTYVRIFHKGD